MKKKTNVGIKKNKKPKYSKKFLKFAKEMEEYKKNTSMWA
jgi:hypothetical protein